MPFWGRSRVGRTLGKGTDVSYADPTTLLASGFLAAVATFASAWWGARQRELRRQPVRARRR